MNRSMVNIPELRIFISNSIHKNLAPLQKWKLPCDLAPNFAFIYDVGNSYFNEQLHLRTIPPCILF